MESNKILHLMTPKGNLLTLQLQICEIMYERKFENNYIVFFNGVLYFFHIINFYNIF